MGASTSFLQIHGIPTKQEEEEGWCVLSDIFYTLRVVEASNLHVKQSTWWEATHLFFFYVYLFCRYFYSVKEKKKNEKEKKSKKMDQKNK